MSDEFAKTKIELMQQVAALKLGVVSDQMGEELAKQMHDAFAYGQSASLLPAGRSNPRGTKQQMYSPWEKLCARMGWKHVGVADREQLAIMEHGEEVFVFGLTKDGEPFTLRGNAMMFPDDELITKLRIIKS